MTKTNNDNELFRACRDGDVTTVERLLPLTPSSVLNRLESNGSSCLHVACSNGHIDIVRRLLENGSSRRLNDRDGHTPLELAKTKEIAELFPRPEEEAKKRYAQNPFKQTEWLFGQDIAETFSRAIEWGCVKDRGIKRTVNKIEDAHKIFGNESKESKLLRFYLSEAKEKNDPTLLLKIYTIEGPFFRTLNYYMASPKKKQVYKRLCKTWSGYYAGIIMKNPALQRYHFSGITYRGMEINLEDLDQYKIGFAITNKTFQSTSMSKKVADRFAHREQPTLGTIPVIITYMILDPKSALDITSLSEFPDEAEVLMVPGCCFKVIKVNQNANEYEFHLRQLVWTEA